MVGVEYPRERAIEGAGYWLLALLVIAAGGLIAWLRSIGSPQLATDPRAATAGEFLAAAVTMLAVPLLIAAFVGEDRPRPSAVPGRLLSAVGANLILALLAIVALIPAILIIMLGSVLGALFVAGVFLWAASRFILVPAAAMLGGAGAGEAIGVSWERTRGMAIFIAMALVVTGLVLFAAAHLLAPLGLPPAAMFAITCLLAAVAHAAVAAWAWRTAGRPTDAPGEGGGPAASAPSAVARRPVPERIVRDTGNVLPDVARLVRLRDTEDLEAIKALPDGGPVWAHIDTRDQDLLAQGVRAGVQVLVADTAHQVMLGLHGVQGPGLARISHDSIRWGDKRYVLAGDDWIRAG